MKKKIIKMHYDSYVPIAMKYPQSNISEQYRKIRSNIELSHIDKNLKTIAVTSTMNEEGKTVTALNLATLYAQGGEKTLVIDLDLRKPKVHRGFKIANVNGISDIITKNLDITECIKEINPHLHILNSGTKLAYPSEFLLSDKVRDLVSKLKKDYDKIIIDTPPVHLVTDASIISNYADGVVFVIASRTTKTEVIKQSLKTLKDNGAYIIGTVLTRVQKNDLDYYRYYYEYKEA